MKTLTLILILCSIFPLTAWSADRNTYVSDIDKSITIHRVGILPPTDNVSGLFSRYVEDTLREQIKKSHRFDLRDLKESDPHLNLDDFQENPDLIKKSGTHNNVDALFSATVNKSEENLTLTIDLFLVSDGKLFAQEEISLAKNAGTSDLEKRTVELYNKVLGKIPYRGLVLSREGNRVTMDLGTQDGIKNNSVVSVVQVIGIKRHPKYGFVVSSDKEILGKIRVEKTDETLSFGLILEEKERGVITVDSKLSGLDFVAYPDSLGGQQALANPDALNDQVSFGKTPKAWNPKKQPGLGKVGLALGLGSMHNAITTQIAGSMSADVSVYPQLNLTGELWLTPKWFMLGRLEEGVTTIPNPLSGSSPGTLSATNSHYSLAGGYKFFLEDDYMGPQINLHLGIGKYSFFIDSSTPTAFTSFSYYGLYFGLGGSLPVSNDKTWYLDATFERYFSPGQSESPVTSGSTTDNSAMEFLIGGSHKMSEAFWVVAHFDFEFYGTNYTGPGTRIAPGGSQDTGLNSTHSLITLLGGVEYYF